MTAERREFQEGGKHYILFKTVKVIF